MTKMKFTILCLLGAFVFLTSCKSSKSTARGDKRSSPTRSVSSDGIIKSDDIQSLKRMMEGHFQNSILDSDSTSIEVTLRVVQIWEEQKGCYLYAEQFATDNPARPQLQQIYKIESDNNGGFRSNVYNLENSEQAVGQWKTPSFFDSVSMDNIIAKEGCTIYITQHGDGSFSGSTRLDQCKSTKDGAAYTTSTIKIRESSFMNWEKGFDDSGNQIWGKELGSSVFKRIQSN